MSTAPTTNLNLGALGAAVATPAAPRASTPSTAAKGKGLSFGDQLKAAKGEPKAGAAAAKSSPQENAAPIRARQPFAPVKKIEAKAPEARDEKDADLEIRDDGDQDTVDTENLDPRWMGLNSEYRAQAAPLKNQKSMNENAVEETGEGGQALGRRAVWNDFLGKMKDLDINPEKIMSAFAMLDDQDLAQAPSASLDKIVAGLGLNDQQTVLAKQFFNDLINKTQSRSMAEDISASATPVGFEPLSLQSERRQAMDQGLDEMSAELSSMDQGGDSLATGALSAEALPSEATGDQFKIGEGRTSATLKPDAASVNRLVEQMESDSTPVSESAIKNLLENQTRPSVNQAFARKTGAGENAATNGAANTDTDKTNPMSFKMGAFNVEPTSAKADTLASNENSDDGQESESETPARTGAFVTDNSNFNANKTGGDFAANLGKAQKNDAPVTVPELMQNAKILIKEGGGEMKVTMTPEGMGQVALKVSVEHGKVNVSMLTQNDEVKHLIERQLGELKASLATSHLQAGEIKVATMSHTQQNQDSSYRDPQPSPTPQNFSQFQERGQERRQMYGDDSRSANRGPSAASATGAVARGAQAAATIRGYGASGTSRRLNLVA